MHPHWPRIAALSLNVALWAGIISCTRVVGL